MPNWRRAHAPGGTYFFTWKTDGCSPLFRDPAARQLLGRMVRDCRTRWPFEADAMVLLPDHIHAIWSLPRGDDDYSTRIAWLKKEFTKCWLAAGGSERFLSQGRANDGRRGVWQPKFWEHTIEDETDFDSHFDYVHWNPVKHGYATCPQEWPWSSFHRWVKRGVYPQRWGCGARPKGFDSLDDLTGE